VVVKRLLSGVWGLSLVGLILIPSAPKGLTGPVGPFVAKSLRKVSVSQHWGMYVPNPQRSHGYMTLTAHYKDGRSEELEETEVERNGWATTWFGVRTRMAIWRYYAELHPKKRSRNREWYLRGACVRETRRTGEIPQKLVMSVVRRRFAPPEAVKAGKLALGQPNKTLVTVQYCNRKAVRVMIEADRERRAAT
jgi:hypothetical protein